MSVDGRKVVLVVIADPISAFVDKGEVVDRYFNPGDLFDEVHLVLVNDDRPSASALERMAGAAKVEVHNLPPGKALWLRTVGYQSDLVNRWMRPVQELARRVRPDVVRAYGSDLDALIAVGTGKRLGIPSAVSVHTIPMLSYSKRSAIGAIRDEVFRRSLHRALRRADVVLPVYESIFPYLRAARVERIELAYNIINGAAIKRKDSYSLDGPTKIISVGRQLPGKDPSNLVKAVADSPDMVLTLVGDGEYHDRLRSLADELGVSERVRFERTLPNDEVCALLPNFDIFAASSDYPELSKALLEALLAGLPLIVNRRPGERVPELTDDICMVVENTPVGYASGLRTLASDGAVRERLGRKAQEVAWSRWDPAKTEARYVDIYRRLMSGAPH